MINWVRDYPLPMLAVQGRQEEAADHKALGQSRRSRIWDMKCERIACGRATRRCPHARRQEGEGKLKLIDHALGKKCRSRDTTGPEQRVMEDVQAVVACRRARLHTSQ